MELFGLLFAVPVTLVTSTVFCVLAFFATQRLPSIRRVAVVCSLCVVASLLVEVVCALTVGPFRLHQRLGAAYTTWHLVGFFLGPPAVALLVLVASSPLVRVGVLRIGIATALCWFACMATLLGNIMVSEDIYGIDGSGHRPTESVFPP
jgi:hypothetical protein